MAAVLPREAFGSWSSDIATAMPATAAPTSASQPTTAYVALCAQGAPRSRPTQAESMAGSAIPRSSSAIVQKKVGPAR